MRFMFFSGGFSLAMLIFGYAALLKDAEPVQMVAASCVKEAPQPMPSIREILAAMPLEIKGNVTRPKRDEIGELIGGL